MKSKEDKIKQQVICSKVDSSVCNKVRGDGIKCKHDKPHIKNENCDKNVCLYYAEEIRVKCKIIKEEVK